MSVAEIDIWRSAKLLIGQHGDEAPIFAAMRADEQLDKGDIEGRAVWLKVFRTIEELLSEKSRQTPRFIKPASVC